jgi:glutamate dehydrogenase (NADP+)
MPAHKALTVDNFMDGLKKRNPREEEFHQAVHEVVSTLIPYIKDHPEYREAQILERMTEPDRVISFRVCWHDDKGNIRTNRGYRVQFNNAIGPYKGGLRFHRELNLSVLKFLGFEQTFKNSLTTLPLGAAKGGANFNPKGKSDGEIMRFCQSLMTELYRYLGPDMDVPAGDGGVGSREISYMFGQYKRLTHQFTGVLTGKSLSFGGSHIRKEATGYGCAYFMKHMLEHHDKKLEGMKCVISGAGNVALYCAQKLIALGAKVLTLSDTSGFIFDKKGLDQEKLDYIIDLKTRRRGNLSDYPAKFGATFHKNQSPWRISCDLAFPCATQNEIGAKEVKSLLKHGCVAIAEGANMPVNTEAHQLLSESEILFAPGKASNAGGVAVSGLEMSQNSTRLYWDQAEMECRLENIMRKIHQQCLEQGTDRNGKVDYVKGANIAGFIKVADAMLAYGAV